MKLYTYARAPACKFFANKDVFVLIKIRSTFDPKVNALLFKSNTRLSKNAFLNGFEGSKRLYLRFNTSLGWGRELLILGYPEDFFVCQGLRMEVLIRT